jgi:hypothetical protein
MKTSEQILEDIIKLPSMSIVYIQRKYQVNYDYAKKLYVEWAHRKGFV